MTNATLKTKSSYHAGQTHHKSVLGLAFLRLAGVFTKAVLLANFCRLRRRHRRCVGNMECLKCQHTMLTQKIQIICKTTECTKHPNKLEFGV